MAELTELARGHDRRQRWWRVPLVHALANFLLSLPSSKTVNSSTISHVFNTFRREKPSNSYIKDPDLQRKFLS